VPAHAAPGERVTVTARVRRLERERFANALAISAKTASGTPIRMWPDASSGVFTGSFIVDETDVSGPISVSAIVDEVFRGADRRRQGHGGLPKGDAEAERVPLQGTVHLFVDRNAIPRDAAPLSMLAGSHGGIDVGAPDLAALERHLRTT